MHARRQAASRPSASQRLIRHRRRDAAGGRDREAQVLAHGQVVVAARSRVRRARGTGDASAGRRVRSTPSTSAVAGVQRHETREEAQQRALAGAVAARDEHDLALVHVEVDAGERREAIEEADGGAKTDDGLH